MTAVNNDLVPNLGSFLDSFAVAEPADVGEVSGNRIELVEPLCGAGLLGEDDRRKADAETSTVAPAARL